MSPRSRKPSKWQRPVSDRPLLGGSQAREDRADGEWNVRRVSGSASGKSYRCPGCDQLIPPATPHVVVWPDNPSLLGALGGAQSLDERRHWHTACWGRRR
ncbi:hypothetical protein OG474_03515 [Kribbella sp. NBC_01505]|uniref:hypothetical protein n=1 Tax=Kribbella sp. NBC_01505 TaxID=2903580 RepID=UPI00386571A0